jgi:hypothetical protein
MVNDLPALCSQVVKLLLEYAPFDHNTLVFPRDWCRADVRIVLMATG